MSDKNYHAILVTVLFSAASNYKDLGLKAEEVLDEADDSAELNGGPSPEYSEEYLQVSGSFLASINKGKTYLQSAQPNQTLAEQIYNDVRNNSDAYFSFLRGEGDTLKDRILTFK